MLNLVAVARETKRMRDQRTKQRYKAESTTTNCHLARRYECCRACTGFLCRQMQMNSKHKKVVKWRSYWSPLSTPNRAECHMLDKPVRGSTTGGDVHGSPYKPTFFSTRANRQPKQFVRYTVRYTVYGIRYTVYASSFIQKPRKVMKKPHRNPTDRKSVV